MENEKEKWIETRTSLIAQFYNVPASEQPRVDAVVDRMRQVAANCSDQGTCTRSSTT